jgi:ParB-like chromosome segregation protein Spo0J
MANRLDCCPAVATAPRGALFAQEIVADDTVVDGDGQARACADAPAAEVDLHRLELRFAAMRLADASAVQRLANSIEDCGQMVACIATGGRDETQLILIDGYRRVAALKRLGRDTALVQRWNCSLAQALSQSLARSSSRRLAAVEEALLLRELIDSHGLSQREAARRCARDVSWVQRRLVLLGAMPEALLQAVREGWLSCWAAVRIVAPLARANMQHASALLSSQRADALSTRQLATWFEHYQRAQSEQRQRMVEHPRLFIDSLAEIGRERDAQELRNGPAPPRDTVGELGYVQTLLVRLGRKLRAQATPAAAPLALACQRVGEVLPGLASELRRLGHDTDRDQQQRADLEGAGPWPARDRPAAQALA